MDVGYDLKLKLIFQSGFAPLLSFVFSTRYFTTLSSSFEPIISVAYFLISSVAFFTATAVFAILNMFLSFRLSPNTVNLSRVKPVISTSVFIAMALQAALS